MKVRSYRDIQLACRAARQKKGLSLRKVARAINGVTDATHLAKFEKGHTGIHHETLFQLLTLYGISLHLKKTAQR